MARKKVGEAYVEVKYDVDFSKALRDMEKFKAAASKAADIKINIDTSGLEEARAKMAALSKDVSKNQKIKVDVDRDHLGRVLNKTRVKIDHDTHGMGRIMGENIFNGFSAILSLLPSRLEFLFTKTGPIVGTAFLLAFTAAVVIGMPAAGAAITGAFFASLGFGAVIGAVVVGAIDDPRVSKAATDLGHKFMDKIIYGASVQHLGQVLADQLNKVSSALDRWAPHIVHILQAGAKFLPGITNGLIGFVDAFLGPLDRLINSPFMKGLMDVVARGMREIGQAFGVSFDRMLKDPAAMEGATKGLQDFFDIMAGTIKLGFDFLRFLSRMWAALNDDNNGKGKSPLDRMRDGWKAIRDYINVVAKAVGAVVVAWVYLGTEIAKAAGDLRPFVDAIAGTLKGAFDDLISVWNSSLKPTLAWAWTQAAPLMSEFGKTIRMAFEALVPAVQKVIVVVKWFWSVFGPTFIAVFKVAWTTLVNVIKAVLQILQGVFMVIQGLFTGNWGMLWNGVKRIFAAAWAGIVAILRGAITLIWTILKNIGPIIWQGLQLLWDLILKGARAAWAGMVQLVRAAWSTTWAIIRGWSSAIWQAIVMAFTTILNFWRSVWNSIYSWVVNKWHQIYNTVVTVVTSVLNRIRNTLLTVKSYWVAIWTSIHAYVVNKWAAIRATVYNGIMAVYNRIRGTITAVLQFWRNVWNSVFSWVVTKWAQIVSLVRTRVGQTRDAIHKAVDNIKAKWNAIWSGLATAFKGVWTTIVNHAKDGLNAIIDKLNAGIGKIQGLLSKLHIDWKIPTIPRLAGGGAPASANPGGGLRGAASGLQKFARGGRVFGQGTGTSDSVPAMLSRNEFVMNARSTKKLGLDRLAFMNKFGQMPMGFAAGGRVGAANNGLLNEHRNHLHVAMMQGVNYIIELAKRSHIPFQVTSTTRPGDRVANGGLSWHSSGKAVDFGGFNQDALASYFSHIQGVVELIHRSSMRDYAIFGGKPSAGGGFFGPFMDFFGKSWGSIVDKTIKPVTNGVKNLIPDGAFGGKMFKGILGTGMDKFIGVLKGQYDKAQKDMASMGGDQGGSGGAGGGIWLGTVLQALRMLHLPLSWAGPTTRLIGRESGGNPRAINNWDVNARHGDPSRGLMQTIGSTFNANKYPGYNNIYGPLDNILAGLTYIKRRYGTIFNVQQAVGATPRGYANGGPVSPGWNLFHEPEMALNAAQGKALERRIAGDGGGAGIYIENLNITVAGALAEADAKKAAQKIIDELNKKAGRNGGKTGIRNM